MKLRRAFFGLLAAVALGGVVLGPGIASADGHEDDDFTRPGAFAGLGFKWQVEGFQGEYRDQDYGNSWGFDARGGYRFADWFAVEGIFEYADDFGANAPRARGDDLSMITTTGNAKFIVPIERFQPYLTLGMGFLYVNSGEGFVDAVEDDNWGFAGRIGGGVDIYLTRHISLYVDNAWTMATEDAEDLYFYSLGGGAKYNF